MKMKIPELDLGTIFGNLFKTPVLSPPAGPEKPSGASFGVHPAKRSPINSSATSFSMLPGALSSTSSLVASNPVRVKSSVYSPMSVAAVRELNSSMLHLAVQAQFSQSSSSFASQQGASIRGNATNLRRPSPNAVQTFHWNAPSKIHPLIQGTGSLAQEDLNQKKKVNKQNPGHGYPERSSYAVPIRFTTSVVGAIENFHSISPDSCGSPLSDGRAMPGSPPASWSGIPSCTTGLSTERSSICSWRDDEFDRANTQRVCQLFSDVDELLYEGKQSSRTRALLEECREWNGHSPHLRILGNQLETLKEEGFQYFHRRATCSNTGGAPPAPHPESWSESKELCIEGQRLLPTASSIRNVLSAHSRASVLEEEVYEAEGRIEEFFAYDAKEADEEGADRGSGLGPGQSGVPPVSPHACIRDAVAGEVFDDVWREAVRILQGELLHKHWESELTDGASHVGTSELSKMGCNSSSHILLKTLSDPASRGSDTRSMSLWPNIIPRQASRLSSALKSNLNGVMTIQAKPLQQRQHGSNDKPQCDAEDRVGTLISAGKGQGRLMEHNVLSASRGACTFSQKLPAQRRLPKLSAETKPFRGHGILRGTKLSTVTEGLATVNAASKQRFPAIRMDALEQDLPLPTSRHIPQQRGRFLQSRVVSAVHPTSVSGLPPLREPTLLLESLTRPNTTHTFRSDTPIKRSFTPLEIAYHMRAGRGSMQGEPSHIGVTGFSVGIVCSTANSLAECPGVPHKRPLNPASAEDEEGEGQLSMGAFHQRKAFSRIPTHCKKKLQVALS